MEHMRKPREHHIRTKKHYHLHQCFCTCPYPHINPFDQPLFWHFAPTHPQLAVPSSYDHPRAHLNYPGNLINPEDKYVASMDSDNFPTWENPLDGEDENLPDDEQTREDFAKFLEWGCVIAEKISIRNQHRSYFRNLQHLCERTKNDLIKPTDILCNIHSYGVPIVMKDFMIAYAHLSNCWALVSEYLNLNEREMRNIAHELTDDFRSCCRLWMEHSELLAKHMVRIFSNLDTHLQTRHVNLNTSCNRNVVMIPSVGLPLAERQNVKRFNRNGSSTFRKSTYNAEKEAHISLYFRASKEKQSKEKVSVFPQKSMLDQLCDVEKIKQRLFNDMHRHKREDSSDCSLDGEPFNEQTNVSKLSLEQKIVAPPSKNAKNERILRYSQSFLKQIFEREDCCRIIRSCLSTQSTDTDLHQIRLLLDTLDKTPFNGTLTADRARGVDYVNNVQCIIQKYISKSYRNMEAVVGDIEDIVKRAKVFYNDNPNVSTQLDEFCSIIDEWMQCMFCQICAEEERIAKE